MKIDLSEKISIKPEFKSYNNQTINSYNIRIGSKTLRTNFVTNKVDVSWKLKNYLGFPLKSGIISADIDSFNANIQIDNLDLNFIYTFEVINPDFSKNVSIIFTGDVSNFTTIDEDFVFNDGGVEVYGDLIFTPEKKIRFSYDWSLDNKIGNGIIVYKNKYYLYSPKYIFTSRILDAKNIKFSPFSGYAEKNIRIVTIPSVEQISPYEFIVNPPSKFEITFYYQKDDFTGNVLQKKTFKNPVTKTTTSGKININNLNTDDDYTSFEFKMMYK